MDNWFRTMVEDARKKTEGRSSTRRSADVNAAWAALKKEQTDEALTVNLS